MRYGFRRVIVVDERWLQVLGLVLIIEALLPFISPRSYRQAVQQIANTPDKALRAIALVILVVGAVLVMLSHR
ncbi:MAG: hypothetical protein B7X28_01980 [Halothiobacillus sp. 13-55-253]|jgi:uncharacterized protein YjeT (DUF2065 family)|nr:MAG: hypothetical protein B7X37_07295 [Halothiobacillus sp. 14-55-98]OZB83578.1 MAG: hypothetical protein B7X28_01980 [Halothiobacillus sp. 13-55-253]